MKANKRSRDAIDVEEVSRYNKTQKTMQMKLTSDDIVTKIIKNKYNTSVILPKAVFEYNGFIYSCTNKNKYLANRW